MECSRNDWSLSTRGSTIWFSIANNSNWIFTEQSRKTDEIYIKYKMTWSRNISSNLLIMWKKNKYHISRCLILFIFNKASTEYTLNVHSQLSFVSVPFYLLLFTIQPHSVNIWSVVIISNFLFEFFRRSSVTQIW